MLRSGYISYCAIKKFDEIEKNFSSPKLENQVKMLTKEYKERAKYFYLPLIKPNGFSDRMAVDFSCIHQVSVDVIKQLISKRMCGLNEIALEHFKIKLGNYFKRYAYDPWYVLNKEEYNSYLSKLEEEEKEITKPYDWQS